MSRTPPGSESTILSTAVEPLRPWTVQPAIDQAAELLDRARSAGIPIFHIQRDAGEGSPYDVRAEIAAVSDLFGVVVPTAAGIPD